MDTLYDQLSRLEGLIPEALGRKLLDLASMVQPPNCVVEIGSYKGKSTCYLASGARMGAGALVVAVDPWDSPGNPTGRFGFAAGETRAAFNRQVASMGLESQVLPLRGFSERVAPLWTRPIGLLYIDGSHTEQDVQKDWRLWSPFLVKGGVVAFDDYDTPKNPGVKAVVDRLAAVPGVRLELGPAPLAIVRL